MKSVSKTTKIAVGAAILAVGGFSGIGLANAAQMSSTEQAEVSHATPATPAVPATPTLPAKPAVPAVPAAPSTDGKAKGDAEADVDGTEGAVDGSADAKDGATVKGDPRGKGAAREARAHPNNHPIQVAHMLTKHVTTFLLQGVDPFRRGAAASSSAK